MSRIAGDDLLLGGPVEGRTLRQLVDVSGGNPLLLREVLERTVENHLYRVFRKLHIGSRAELADVFGADRTT